MSERKIDLLEGESLHRERIALPEEVWFCINVNGEPIVRLAATPIDLKALAVGFLFYNGYIQSAEEIAAFHLSEAPCADVWLTHAVAPLHGTPLLTSGCGQGVVFDELYAPLQPIRKHLRFDPRRLPTMLAAMQQAATHYRRSHGLHVSALFTAEGRMLAVAEDIGRHNTLDKLIGYLLLQEVQEASILLTTGRISSEMISKAARMGLPLVATLKTLSSLAVEMAERWGITALGHITARRMRLYTHPHRLRLDGPPSPPPEPTPAGG